MQKMKIGVIGGGIYGTKMLNCFYYQQQLGRVELVAVADLDEQVLSRHVEAFGVRAFQDFRQMIETSNLDGVAIATPDHLHAPIIQYSVEHEVHVLCQKPLDVDVARALQLVELCEQKQVLLYVDFHKRFDLGHIKLRSDIQEGSLGKLQYGWAHMEDRIEVPSVWLKKWASSSSPSWFLGVHFYDLVYWLTGQLPVQVFATGHKGKRESMGLLNTWDSIQATVNYDGGLSMSYHLSWILPDSFPTIVNQGLRLVGEEGIAEVDSQDRGFFAAYSKSPSSLINNPFASTEYESSLYGLTTDGYTYQSMSFFIDIWQQLQSGRDFIELQNYYPHGRSALVASQIAAAVDESITRESIVNIEPLTVRK